MTMADENERSTKVELSRAHQDEVVAVDFEALERKRKLASKSAKSSKSGATGWN